jgi:hypothetical protein
VSTNQLVFYSENQIEFHFLLKEFKIPFVQNDQKQGLYLLRDQFGKSFQKRLEFDLTQNLPKNCKAAFVLKPLNEFEFFNLIAEFQKNTQFEVYLLAHKLFHFAELVLELQKAGVSRQNIFLITSSEIIDNQFVLKDHEVKKYFSTVDPIQMITVSFKESKNKTETKKSDFVLPFVVVTFLKVLLSPTLEIKRAYHRLQVSQFVWSKRFDELISFILFLFSSLAQIFHLMMYLYGFIIRITIPVYFKTRHLFLMGAFKTYGFIIDLFFIFKYTVTWILPYPLYKAYWFLEFQYNHRIKNKIWTE